MKAQSSEIFNSPPPDFVPVEMVEVSVYCPNRLEYFAAKALQGLLVGRSEKDQRSCAKRAVVLAKELIDNVDSKEG